METDEAGRPHLAICRSPGKSPISKDLKYDTSHSPSLATSRPPPAPPSAPHLLGDWSPAGPIGRLHDRHIARAATPWLTSRSGSMPATVSSFTTLSKRGLILMLPAAAWAYVRAGRGTGASSGAVGADGADSSAPAGGR